MGLELHGDVQDSSPVAVESWGKIYVTVNWFIFMMRYVTNCRGRVKKLRPLILASKDESFSRMASWGPFYWKIFLLRPWSGMIKILSWPVWDIAIFNVGSDFPLTLCFGTRVISLIEWPISINKISLPLDSCLSKWLIPHQIKKLASWFFGRFQRNALHALTCYFLPDKLYHMYSSILRHQGLP